MTKIARVRLATAKAWIVDMKTWREHDENRKKLDACSRHLFEPLRDDDIVPGARVPCKKCGGMMDLVGLNYYVRGYEASGKHGNDIVPNWRPDDQPVEPGTFRTYFKGPDDT